MAENTKHVSYADAGVDTAEGARAVDAIKAAVATTSRPEVIGGLGGFGSCFSAAGLKDMEEPILVSGTDGVGTKLAIAQLLDRHETVGEDLVAMCVDEGCRKSGCALVGGEMAEHPGVMAEGDYDLAGFVVGVVDRPKMIGPDKVREGDVILGLPSSGIHSNGYSLVRKVAIEGKTVEELETPLPELGGESIADAVMRPTTIYAGGLLKALRAGAPIHAMAHITGGGITENLDRAMPEGLDALVYRGGASGPAWDIPPVITYMIDAAQLTLEEAYRTFNMGVGMSVICAAEDKDAVVTALEDAGFAPFVMGEVIAGVQGEKGKVVYDDER